MLNVNTFFLNIQQTTNFIKGLNFGQLNRTFVTFMSFIWQVWALSVIDTWMEKSCQGLTGRINYTSHNKYGSQGYDVTNHCDKHITFLGDKDLFHLVKSIEF